MAVIDAIQDHHVTSMIIVPTMLADLVSASKTGYFLIHFVISFLAFKCDPTYINISCD